VSAPKLFGIYTAQFPFLDVQEAKIRPVIIVGKPQKQHKILAVVPISLKSTLEEVDMVVAYGGRQEDFYDFFGLGNYILYHGNAAAKTEDDKPTKKIVMLPYDDIQGGHYLAAGRCAAQEGIFWDGVRLDFDSFGSSESIPQLLGGIACQGE